MVSNSDLQKWQTATKGINELGQKDLTQEEWSALVTLNTSMQNRNFDSNESQCAITLLKDNYNQHKDNQVLQMHLYNFIVLCEQYCKKTNVSNAVASEVKGSVVKNRISNSDIQKWHTAANGINASGQKDLTKEEWSALSTLNNSLSSGNFDSDQSKAALVLLKQSFIRHDNNRILQTHLQNFITLCEQYIGATNIVDKALFVERGEKEQNEKKGFVIRNILFGEAGQFKQTLLKNLKYTAIYFIIAAALIGIIYALSVLKQTLMPGYVTALVIGTLTSLVVLRKNQNGAFREKFAFLGATAAGILMYSLKGGPISGGYAFVWTFIVVGLILSFLGKNKPKLLVLLVEIVPSALCFLAFERLGGAISGFGAKELFWTNIASVRYMEAVKIFLWFCLFQSFANNVNNVVNAQYRKTVYSKNNWSFYILPVATISLFLFVFLNPTNLPIIDTYKSKLTMFSQPARASADVFDENGNKIGKAQITPRSTPLLSKHIPGYLATAYDFSYTGDFDKASITFAFDEGLGNILDTLHFKPRIYYFNDEDGTLEELPNQSADDYKGWVSVTAVSSHFSTYILLNKVEFDAVWNTEIRRPPGSDPCPCGSSAALPTNAENFDIAFVIDESGSMTQNDPGRLRVEATKQFVDMAAADSPKNRAAIFGFTTSARTVLNLTALNDKEEAKNSLNSIYSSGGTNIFSGLESAVKELETKSSDSYSPVIVLMTDGQDNSQFTNYTPLINRANEKGITVFAIGLGRDVNSTLLRQICDNTGGGVYYYAENADVLPFIFKSAKTAIIEYEKDSNGDGISDYYAQLLYDGTLRLSNGSGQFIGADFLISNKDDFDGDGFKNSKELVVTTKVIHGVVQVFVTMRSNPTDKNSTPKDNSTGSNYFTYSGGDIASGKNGDFITDYTFSTDYFKDPANVYNHELSIMSLQLSMSAFGLHKEPYGITKPNNIRCLLSCMGFEDIVHYGYEREPTENSIAATIAKMSLPDGDELLVIAVRGGEYEFEWGGNFYIGDGDVHEGFRIAKEKVMGYFMEYQSKHWKDLNGKNVKLWITGYSRGSAVANLLGAHFNDITIRNNNTFGIPGDSFSLKRTNIYTYCFATPNVSKKAQSSKENSNYDNIFYTIGPFDFVPRIPFGVDVDGWGFKKYGKEVLLPNPKVTMYYLLESNMLEELNKLNSSFDETTYLINKFKVHKGNTGRFLTSIYDLGRHDQGRGSEKMDEYLEHLISKTVRNVFGTQEDYVKDVEPYARAMKGGNYTLITEKGFMEIFTDLINIILDLGLNIMLDGHNNDDIATLGPSDEHLKRLLNDDDNIGKLDVIHRFPAVYNFGEGSTDLNFNDGYDIIMREKGLNTRKEAVKEGAKEAKNNLRALTSGHYPELYLAWLKSLRDSKYLDDVKNNLK